MKKKGFKELTKKFYGKGCFTKRQCSRIRPLRSNPDTNSPSFCPILSAVRIPTFDLAEFLVLFVS